MGECGSCGGGGPFSVGRELAEFVFSVRTAKQLADELIAYLQTLEG